MGNVGVQLDQHTLDRLDALLLLLKELEPNQHCDRGEALRLSLDVGINLLLGELLARGTRRDTRAAGFPTIRSTRLGA